jgi:hypothetical protein
MGTWAEGPFDNDSAADFAHGVRERTDAQARHDLLLATLRAGIEILPNQQLTNEYAWGYELEFAVASAAFVADEYTGVKKFTDTPYARGVSEDGDDLLPFVEIHLSDELLSAAREFIVLMVRRMQFCRIDAEWVEPVAEIGTALALGA